MATLSTSGVMNNVNTILGLIQRMDAAVVALPEVVGLFEAAISTFSNHDKETIQVAYKQKMADTDQAHGQTQEALAQATNPEGETSPKGGGL